MCCAGQSGPQIHILWLIKTEIWPSVVFGKRHQGHLILVYTRNRKCTLNNRGLMISYLYFKGNLLERKSHTAVSWDWIILYIVQSFPTFYFLSFLFCYTFISLCCLICSKMIGMTQHYYSLNFLSKLLYCCTGLSIYEHHLEASIICFSANRIQTD